MPSELDYVVAHFVVELPHVALVQFLPSYNLVDLFLIQVVVLVQVDRHISHILVLRLEKSSHSLLRLLQVREMVKLFIIRTYSEDLLDFMVDHGFVPLTQIFVILRNVASFFTIHPKRLNCTVC